MKRGYMTTIQITPETLQKLRIKKVHNSLKSYDQVINYLLDKPQPQSKVRMVKNG